MGNVDNKTTMKTNKKQTEKKRKSISISEIFLFIDFDGPFF